MFILITAILIYKLRIMQQNQSLINTNLEFEKEISKKIYGGLIAGEGRSVNTLNYLSINHDIDTVELNDAIKPNSIILYYNEINCMTCIEDALQVLKQRLGSNESIKYQIIANYENLRDVLVFKKANKIEKDIFKPIIDDNQKSVFFDQAYVALVDENYMLHHVFILDTESKSRLGDYLDLLQYSKYYKK